MSSPTTLSPNNKNINPETRPLRFGDLIRVSALGSKKNKRLNDRARALGRVNSVLMDGKFEIEWILEGGRIVVEREDVLWTTAEAEGMTSNSNTRKRRKPTFISMDVVRKSKASKTKNSTPPERTKEESTKKVRKPRTTTAKKTNVAATSSRKGTTKSKPKTAPDTKVAAKKRKTTPPVPEPPVVAAASDGLELYEKHRRELERSFKRLEQKIDVFQHFAKDSSRNETKKVATDNNSPRNWETIRQRMESGRYTVDRKKQQEEARQVLFGEHHSELLERKRLKEVRVACPIGVHWELFRNDVFAMVDAALESEEEPDDDDNEGVRGTIRYSVRKIKEALQQTMEKAGQRHAKEMMFADDRLKYMEAIQEGTNAEAAMQSWRKVPFPERVYERLSADAICAGLSPVDGKIADFERRTQLPDSFIGLSYRYDGSHQSETWMQSVVDETGQKETADNERRAALALSADEGVRRAQVNGAMQSLLIAVQDKVMTDAQVLQEPELKSANWLAEECSASSQPEIVEQPVWGIDCYTRRNILLCLETEFDTETALVFVEKWLLPAINACPEPLAHKVSNAARILEGLPFEETEGQTMWSRTVLGTALEEKIRLSCPVWLKAAANSLRRAAEALGLDFFRVHPKGHGSVVLCKTIPPNTLVTYYRGELYPSWRWGEKMDAIEITQKRTKLKPALPDFYNMVLERPQSDPRGYGLLFVDASRKAGHGSSLSHSCAPTCEVRVAARDGGLCLAMTTLRELEMGEELTFDYNAVTESLNEYQSAVCLCGYGKCRGSFLHFATADCYQQVLNRNSPIAARFASLVKASMKQVMSQEDDKILLTHGFNTAAFGAISVIRREAGSGIEKTTLADSIEVVPIWLKTYVADVLRYIEYERRALPIALICDHIASSKEEDETQAIELPSKEPKKEPSFFYFSRTQSAFLSNMLVEKGFPSSLKGLQRKHAMQKVAAAYWGDLGEDEKERWKEEAEQEYQKKVEAWGSGKTKQKPASKQKLSSKQKTKPDMEEILVSSKISFQDADHEAVSNTEQRIQQLTQSLSRVGRVLDRHRESCYDKENREDAALIDEVVQPPVRFLSEEEVVDWLWKSNDGLVPSLIESTKRSRCTRSCLSEVLEEIRNNFLALISHSGDHEKDNGAGPQATDVNSESKAGLLRIRQAINDELKNMAKEVRKLKSRDKGSNGLESQQTSAAPSDNEDNDGESALSAAFPPPCCLAIDTSLCSKPDSEEQNSDNAVHRMSENITRIDGELPDEHWIAFYGERCALQAAADVLLLYANTSTFFVLQPYTVLKSTPIEVYARELGNEVPKSVMDNNVTSSNSKGDNVSRGEGNSSKPAGPANRKGVCAPDDIIANVSVEYQGEYVLSQLLQWYSGGIGQQPGLPDLLGCSLLPRIADCWSSEHFRRTNTKADRKTFYETKIRRRLVEWLKDPFERGGCWPQDIRKAFAGEQIASIFKDPCSSFVPFGSPIIDFLVTGDESNINSILRILDGNDKIFKKGESSDGLLNSVDKGRPAQAVSTWVQCENPDCQKWRRIPWFVDADVLPEKFFCADNKWNLSANSCDHPEDDWDSADALVGTDGKVEGTPIKKVDKKCADATKVDEMSFDVTQESSFTVGKRFDVKRSDQEKYTTATVQKVDFSGPEKRIFFHFLRSSSDRDEWVPLGSNRIAPPNSRVSIAEPKKKQTKRKTSSSQGRNSNVGDPSDLASFVAGGEQATGKERYYPAIVKQVVQSDESKAQIKFHFMRTSSDSDEWVEFGDPRIAQYKTKVPERMEKRKEKQIKNATSTEKRVSVLAVSISKTVLHSDQASIENTPSPVQDPSPKVSVAAAAIADSDMASTDTEPHSGLCDPSLVETAPRKTDPTELPPDGATFVSRTPDSIEHPTICATSESREAHPTSLSLQQASLSSETKPTETESMKPFFAKPTSDAPSSRETEQAETELRHVGSAHATSSEAGSLTHAGVSESPAMDPSSHVRYEREGLPYEARMKIYQERNLPKSASEHVHSSGASGCIAHSTDMIQAQERFVPEHRTFARDRTLDMGHAMEEHPINTRSMPYHVAGQSNPLHLQQLEQQVQYGRFDTPSYTYNQTRHPEAYADFEEQRQYRPQITGRSIGPHVQRGPDFMFPHHIGQPSLIQQQQRLAAVRRPQFNEAFYPHPVSVDHTHSQRGVHQQVQWNHHQQQQQQPISAEHFAHQHHMQSTMQSRNPAFHGREAPIMPSPPVQRQQQVRSHVPASPLDVLAAVSDMQLQLDAPPR